MPHETDLETARIAKSQLASRLSGRQGITGFGIGKDDKGGYIVHVLLTAAGAGGSIPRTCHGVRIRTQVSGPARSL